MDEELEMGQYWVEFVDLAKDQTSLVAVFDTRQEATHALHAEWQRWQTLASGNRFRHSVSGLSDDRFIVRTSGQTVVYRVAPNSTDAAEDSAT